MPRNPAKNHFANRLLEWWQIKGRHSLPWQLARTPYRVWVAEIMLQQTQVATVVPYFERFVEAFPDLESLANADLDEVLALWSGLGYYARARNLQAAARICMEGFEGSLPETSEALETLPGIGRSTANAIVAQAFNRRAPILDGNARRVLARHAGIEGWPGHRTVERALWDTAEQTTPEHHAADYTQAIMDLGATVCTPRNPDCPECPVSADCVARREGLIGEIPGRRVRRSRPRRRVRLVLSENDRGEILLARRPPAGIWGGLWCLPETGETNTNMAKQDASPVAHLEHSLTHFIMDIEVYRLPPAGLTPIEDDENLAWFGPRAALKLGLPGPVRTIIENHTGVDG